MAFLIGERPQEIARRAVPKQNRTVTGASRDRAIRRGYRESTDRIFVISDGDLRATAHLPEPKRLISAYSHGAFPVGTEGSPNHGVIVPREPSRWLAVFNTPNDGRLVGAA